MVRNKQTVFFLLFLSVTVSTSAGLETSQEMTRNNKFLNLITWVRFDNAPCKSTVGDNGTCYTPKECQKLKGKAAGVCASGFGVCCVLKHTCGEKATINNTYFVNPKYPSPYNVIGQCMMTVLKVNKNICQLRLDFLDFDLLQPDETTHQCIKDRFLVSAASPVPIICGNNKGAHMYIDAGLGNSPSVMTLITNGEYSRVFKIVVRQIPCGASYRAWEGCLQFHDSVSGRLESYNFNGAVGRQLSSQDYTICIRTQRGFCGISYAACRDTARTHRQPETFTVSGHALMQPDIPGVALVGDTSCVTDWLNIPCATTASGGGGVSGRQSPGSNPEFCVDRLCGESFCSVTDFPTGELLQAANNCSSTAAADCSMASANCSVAAPCPVTKPCAAAPCPVPQCAVFSYARPFLVRVHFDDEETEDGPPYLNRGFCLDFVQQPCTS